MPKFLIQTVKTGCFTHETILTNVHYKKADDGDIRIVLMSDWPEQYVRKSWAPVNKSKIKRGQL